MAKKLRAPRSLHIDFKPSEKQYEVWKCLQPECPICGGKVTQVECGKDRNGQPLYKAVCSQCGNEDIPQVILEGGAAGGGKALLLDELVCTPFGFRRVGDLKVGDTITSPNTGGMQKVVWVHPIEKHDYYRVHFVDGTFIDCSEGHLWQCHVSRGKTKRKDGQCEKVWSTISMFEWYNRKKSGMYNGVNLIIPISEPVQFTVGNRYGTTPIHPYVLGAIIGDGCLTDSGTKNRKVLFTTLDQEIIDNVLEKGGHKIAKACDKEGTNAKSYYLDGNGIYEGFEKLGLVGLGSLHKFIPKQYKYGTIENRLELMRGLLDTDGYVDSRGHVSYSTISPQLAEDVAFIARSLGCVASIKRDGAGYKKDGEYIKCNDAYTVYIRCEDTSRLVSLKRKKDRCVVGFNGGSSKLGKRIVDIEYIGEREGRCITVSEPNGLFITNDFTVTHNSFLGSAWLIASCIRWDDMRMVVARLTLKSLRESTWNTICAIVRDWGLEEDVNYRIDSLHGEMIFWNNSKIIMKELADTLMDPDFQRLGSSEYSGAFVDEVGQISQKAIDVLGSRIRWKVENTTVVPKLLMSTNPCLGWVRDRFVMDEEGNDVVMKKHDRYIPFSVFDNPDERFRRAYLVALDNIKDQATKERLKYGNWNWVDTNEAAAYWNFDGSKHLITKLREEHYDPTKPIIISWDFNVMPYMSTLALQIDYENKKVYVIEETLGKPEEKENNTPKLARKLEAKYLNEGHIGGLLVTGDPSGLARSTQTEEGVNNYTIILGNMSSPILGTKKKLLSKQPSQTTRLEFVNALFNGYCGWSIEIDMRCRKLTEDLIYQKKNSDGTKSKKKVVDPKSGIKYEKYGHLSDCLDYALVLFLPELWAKFNKKGTEVQTTELPVYTSFDF